MVVPEEAALALMEGVTKGGYPVDITAQPAVDCIGQPELGCASSGLEPAAVAELEVGYTVLDTQEAYSGEQDFPSSITEVIQPMEMAELVDILPTLSLIEEEIPSCPPTPSVMDMLESFGLGIGENNNFFDLGNSDLISGADLSQPNVHNNDSNVSEAYSEDTGLEGQEVLVSHATLSGDGGDMPVVSWDFPPEETETQQAPSKGACLPVRNQVEWDRPSTSSS